MRLVVIATAAAMVVACAGGPHRTTGTGPATVQTPLPSLPPSVSAPATMLPGNIVPFVNEPAHASEFQATMPTRPQPPPPSGPPCTSSQLAGTLPRWVRKSIDNDGERMDPVTAASLYGWVVMTNTSDKPCTLQGKVDARLVDAAGELRVDYSNDINTIAQKAVTGVPPDAQASLRLDWSAPFCGTVDGSLTVHVTLPNNGGTLDAPVIDPSVPGCVTEENHPELASGVFVSAFSPGDAAKAPVLPTSPLSVLTTSIVSHPTTGSPGRTIRYVVALTNPTGTAVSLAGPVGFSQFIASTGGSGVDPFQYGNLFRLNRRVVTSIAAHQAVRYEVVLTIPATLKPGLTMHVNWLLRAPWLTSDVNSTNGFIITIK